MHLKQCFLKIQKKLNEVYLPYMKKDEMPSKEVVISLLAKTGDSFTRTQRWFRNRFAGSKDR